MPGSRQFRQGPGGGVLTTFFKSSAYFTEGRTDLHREACLEILVRTAPFEKQTYKYWYGLPPLEKFASRGEGVRTSISKGIRP